MALLAASVYLLWPHAAAEDVKIEGKTCLQVYDRRGHPLWRKDLGVPVVLAERMWDRHGAWRAIATLPADGPDSGCILMFDESGRRIKRFDPGQVSPYGANWLLDRHFNRMLIADLLPEPGEEIVAVGICGWYPSQICILSEDGELLREYWHPGVVNGMLRIGNSTRIVFWGPNNDLRIPAEREPGTDDYFYAIYCIDATMPSGQLPPYAAPNTPPREPLWYKVLVPKGRGIIEVRPRNDSRNGRSQLEVVCHQGWTVYLDADGRVLSEPRRQDTHRYPASELIDVVPLVRQQRARPDASAGSGE